MKSVPMPSVVATEKWAISDGVNANSASATLAAPSENSLRAANHRASPNAMPSSVFMGRVCQAIHSGPGCMAVTRKPVGSCCQTKSVRARASGRLSHSRPSGG